MSNKQITVLYFAALAEQAKKDEEIISIPNDATLQDLYQKLRKQYGLTLKQSKLAVAINHTMKHWQATIQDGDIVAFIPPVAGG